MQRQISKVTQQRWTATEARAALEEFAKSGLSTLAFAKRHGINAQRLYWWTKRLGADERSVSEPRFMAVEVMRGSANGEKGSPSSDLGAEASSPAATVDVMLDNGIRVRVGRAFDAVALRRVIGVIRSC